MQIDTTHVDEDLEAGLKSEKAFKQVAQKVNHLEKFSFRDLIKRDEFLEKCKSSKQGLWELKIRIGTPVRLLCRLWNNSWVAVHVYIKKRDGSIPQSVIDQADKKAIECNNTCHQ